MFFLRWFLCIPWLLFSIWMFLYSMPLSGIYSLMLLWSLMPLEREKTAWMTILFAPVFIWNVGLMEYGLKTIDLHCRVLGYSGTKSPPEFCGYQPDAFATGRNHTEGPLFDRKEQMGVHGFNMILATGGLLSGLKEVAWETAYMSFVPDPSDKGMINEWKSIRLKQCDGGKSVQKKEISEGRGAFLLDSSTIRSLVATHVRAGLKVKEGTPKTFKPQKVSFKASTQSVGNDNAYYGALMQTDNFKDRLHWLSQMGNYMLRQNMMETSLFLIFNGRERSPILPMLNFYFPFLPSGNFRYYNIIPTSIRNFLCYSVKVFFVVCK